MSNESQSPLATSALPQNRAWLIAGGILCLLVGVSAISAPGVFSAILVQLLGAFCLVTGVISFFVALVEKDVPHRILNALLGLVRVGVGLVLLLFVLSGALTLTLILAIFFLIEGFFCTVTAFNMRHRSGWVWLLLNGIAAIALGVMVLNKWPSDAMWVIGLLFGINAIFGGMSLLFLGLGMAKKS